MKTGAHTTFAERTGRALGRMWKGVARLDRKVRQRFVASGLSAGAAAALLWIVKLVALGVLLYAAFWLALLLVFAVVAAWAARHADMNEEEPQPEWRQGHSGFGLYDKSEWRLDLGGSDDD